MNIAMDVKDKLILFTWIAGFIILISVIWILTQPVQSYYLLRTVNNLFISNEDSRRLTYNIPVKNSKAALMGYWYSMHNTQDKMFVFTVFQDGILIPLGAIVSAEGGVCEIIPLSDHAQYVYKNLPENILQMYIKRIEGMKNE